MARSWRLPFRRKNKQRKEIGPFYTRSPEGKDICLRTKDAAKALKRLVEAKQGRRTFENDDAGAARAVAEALVGTGGEPSPVVEPPPPAASGLPAGGPPAPSALLPPTHTAAAALPPVPPQPQPESPAGGSSGAPTPVTGPIIPPPAGWADQVAAAAAAPSSSGPAGEGGDIDLDDLKLSEAELDEVLGEAAAWVVELQLGLQAELAKRGYVVPKLKVKMAQVPADAKGRSIGAKFWKRCFKKLIAKYFPDLDLPDWLVAPVLTAALTLPVQLGQGAELIRPDGSTVKVPEAAPTPSP